MVRRSFWFTVIIRYIRSFAVSETWVQTPLEMLNCPFLILENSDGKSGASKGRQAENMAYRMTPSDHTSHCFPYFPSITSGAM